MFKPAEAVIVRRPTGFGKNNEVLAGTVVSATSARVRVALDEGTREFAASQVTKASANEVNNFFDDREQIVQSFKRR